MHSSQDQLPQEHQFTNFKANKAYVWSDFHHCVRKAQHLRSQTKTSCLLCSWESKWALTMKLD